MHADFGSKEAQKEFFAESLIMKDFDHPNVLGLLGVCLDSPNGVPYLVLPFMENGSLKEYLKTKRLHVTNFDTLPEVPVGAASRKAIFVTLTRPLL